MKRNYSLILFAFVFAGIALLSCSREDAKIIPTENQGDIPISQIVGKKTKITLKGHKASDDMTKMPHEKINVFYNSHSYKFISENEEQTNDMVNFVGVITKVSHKDGEEPKYGDIIALYPYDKKATIDTTNNANVISTLHLQKIKLSLCH